MFAFSSEKKYNCYEGNNVHQTIQRFGRETIEKHLQDHNTSGTAEALTESEGRYLLSFGTLDALRTRLAEEGHAVLARVDRKDIPQYQIRKLTPTHTADTGLPLASVQTEPAPICSTPIQSCRGMAYQAAKAKAQSERGGTRRLDIEGSTIILCALKVHRVPHPA